jgi:hypothetical protein
LYPVPLLPKGAGWLLHSCAAWVRASNLLAAITPQPLAASYPRSVLALLPTLPPPLFRLDVAVCLWASASSLDDSVAGQREADSVPERGREAC